MRILVTNDDGIDAIGLHVLARAMKPLGDVVIVAPDEEYSGYGAAIGPIWLMAPEVYRAQVDGIDEAWAVTGPPALCVMFARMGAFGDVDLVVSGINPGANVGRSVYHSGTVGACLSGRNGGWSGIAVSQASDGWGVEGQAWDEMVRLQRWETAAAVASAFVRGYLERPPTEIVIANVNVPNLALDDVKGWAVTEVGQLPPRAMSNATLVARDGEPDEFDVDVSWGEPVDLPDHTDGGAVERGQVSVTYLTRLQAETRDDMRTAEGALDQLLS